MDYNYDLTIAKAKAFNANSYSDVLYNIGDFAQEVPGRVILGVNIQDNYDNEVEVEHAITAYVTYEG